MKNYPLRVLKKSVIWDRRGRAIGRSASGGLSSPVRLRRMRLERAAYPFWYFCRGFVLTTLLLFAILGGCAAPRGEIQNLYKYHFSLIRPSTGTLNFEDETLYATFAPDSEKINLLVRNKSDTPIKIMWDEAAYVDKTGISHRVISKGTRYEDKERPQTPTMVAPNSSVAEWVIPSDNIYHTFLGWKVSPMFPELVTVSDISLWDRTTFRFILPAEVHGQHKHYEFEFQVRVQ